MSVYNPSGIFFAILYREVPHMLPAKYQPYRPGGFLEKKSFEMFLLYKGMAAILNFPS